MDSRKHVYESARPRHRIDITSTAVSWETLASNVVLHKADAIPMSMLTKIVKEK